MKTACTFSKKKITYSLEILKMLNAFHTVYNSESFVINDRMLKMKAEQKKKKKKLTSQTQDKLFELNLFCCLESLRLDWNHINTLKNEKQDSNQAG